MSRGYIFFLLLCLIPLAGFQAPVASEAIHQGRELVFRGYLSNTPADWRAGIAVLENAANRKPADLEILEELALARYGLIGYCIASESCDDTDELLDDTEEALETVLDKQPQSARAHALLGATLAMRIGLSPAKAIFLGPSSSRHIEKATKLGPEEATVWVEMGNMRFHAPAIFGGDKAEAVKCFAKARKVFDQYPAQKKANWQYLHTMAWLGQSYESTGQTAEAREVYQAVLAEFPDFHWVKNELLPKMTQP